MKTIIIILGLLSSLSLYAGHSEGNGGDHIRATFIKISETIIQYLAETESGQNIVKKHHLDLQALQALAHINIVKVEEKELRDNGGSIVDAIGTRENITLNKTAWYEHFEKNRDVYYLVFHELLRALAINDDNYIISQEINPFPLSKKINTRINSVLPLLSQDLLSDVIDFENSIHGGAGCPTKQSGTIFEFDSEKNTVEIGPKNFIIETSPLRVINRKSCGIAIPFKAKKGKRLIVSLVDFSGKTELKGPADVSLGFEAFVAGIEQKMEFKKFSQKIGEVKGRFIFRRSEVLRSLCSENLILRLNTIALVKKLALDSYARIDLERVTIYLSSEDCTKEGQSL